MSGIERSHAITTDLLLFHRCLRAAERLRGCQSYSYRRQHGRRGGRRDPRAHVWQSDALTTTLGAGAGVLMSEALQAGSNSAQQKSYVAGYEKGQSDAAKRQWQTLNERQRIAPDADDAAHLRLFEGPLPERRVNGVTFAPATATLRIQE